MTRTRRTLWLTMVLAVALALGGSRASAGTPIQKCQSAKLKVASKEITGKMKCAAAASATGAPVDATCLARVTSRADAGYVRAGALCLGANETLHPAVDACVGTLVADVPDSGKCSAASLRALGKGAATEVKCRATDISKPGSFGACDARQDAATADALARAGACGQAALATIAADIHACATALGDVIVPPPSTTITTTTTTTTTPPGQCGGGLLCDTPITCPEGFDCTVDQSHQCVCAPTPACGGSMYPTCGGNCPDGLTCVPQFVDSLIFNLSLCACVPPDLACRTTSRTCGYGACPPGSACRITASLGGCTATCGAP